MQTSVSHPKISSRLHAQSFLCFRNHARGQWPFQSPHSPPVREVVGEPAVICGNSIGALAALSAAAIAPDLARGLVMLNAAGRFDDDPAAGAAPPPAAAAEEEGGVGAWLKGFLARIVSGSIFYSTKYRIGPILKQASKGAGGGGERVGSWDRERG